MFLWSRIPGTAVLPAARTGLHAVPAPRRTVCISCFSRIVSSCVPLSEQRKLLHFCPCFCVSFDTHGLCSLRCWWCFRPGKMAFQPCPRFFPIHGADASAPDQAPARFPCLAYFQGKMIAPQNHTVQIEEHEVQSRHARAVQVYVLTYEYRPPVLLKSLFLGRRYQTGSRAAGRVKHLEAATLSAFQSDFQTNHACV